MITALNSVVDSLYLRLFNSSSPSPWLKALFLDWRKYKQEFSHDHSEPYYVRVPCIGTFRLLQSAHTPYEFVLTNPQIGDILVWNPDKWLSKAAENTGQIYLDFRSKWLQFSNFDIVDQQISNINRCFFSDHQSERQFVKVSRVDLAVDVQGKQLEWDDMNTFVSRARQFEGFTEDLITLQKILSEVAPQKCDKGGANAISIPADYLNILKTLVESALDKPSVTRAISRGELRTLYIGRFSSSLFARLYNKSAEILSSSKDYMLGVWQRGGWDGVSQVTRVEFSLSGEFLKDYHCTPDDDSRNWETFKQNLSGIWHYLTNDWLRHVVPGSNKSQKSYRKELSQFWMVIQQSFDAMATGIRLAIAPPPSIKLAQQLLDQATGCIKTYFALITAAFNKNNPYKSHDDLLVDIIEAVFDSLSPEAIEERRSYYGCDEFTDIQFSLALRENTLKLGKGS